MSPILIGRIRFFGVFGGMGEGNWGDGCLLKRMHIWIPPPFPLLEPQHPQHIGKMGSELRSDPQQSRNKRATTAATNVPGPLLLRRRGLGEDNS